MKIKVIEDDGLPGKIFYYPEEYAFETKPRPPFWTSVLVDTLEILLDIDGRVTGVGGYFPHTRWKSAEFDLPESRCGGVVCEKFATFDSRIPVRIASDWEIRFDKKKGWIRFGNAIKLCEHIEVVSGFIMSIGNNTLCGIWINLKP